jgi:anti-sigma factor RsiW
MLNCEAIDPLVTPYVDGQLADGDRVAVDQHLSACPPCHSRVAAECAVHELIASHKSALTARCAPDSLHQRCATVARGLNAASGASESRSIAQRGFGRGATAPSTIPQLRPPIPLRSRLAPFAAAASLVLIVGTAFVYQLTQSSSRVMAAELAADHVKCFALNGALHTHDDAPTVESSMLSGFGWQMHLPAEAAQLGLELVGSRPCLYGEGKIAHIMYRHNGEPVSLFMLPRTARAQEFVQVMGHHAAIWCANNRTFVLLAHEPKAEVERIATVVQASLR